MNPDLGVSASLSSQDYRQLALQLRRAAAEEFDAHEHSLVYEELKRLSDDALAKGKEDRTA